MIGALVACSLIGSFCQNTVSAQEVLDDGEVGGDDKIVFPGGEEIDAINEIIEDLVKSEEFKSSNSSTNDADSSIVRTTTGLKYIITNFPTHGILFSRYPGSTVSKLQNSCPYPHNTLLIKGERVKNF